MVASPPDWPDFTKAILLVGVDVSGDPVGVLVDSAGNLNAILKGQGVGGLTTVAVDANGRLETFILDQEDQWGDVIRIGTAELASRLGGLMKWDWRGNVVYSYDFGQGFGHHLQYPSGTGASIALDPVFWLHGGYSCKLIGGSDGAREARIRGITSHCPADRVGLQVCVSLIGSPESVTIELRRWSGGKVYYTNARWDRANFKAQYRDDAGAYQDLGDCLLGGEDEAFTYLKVVSDIGTLKYSRALFGAVQYDLTSYDLYQSGTGFLHSLYYDVSVISRSGNNDGCYVDSIVVTSNEPE